MTDSSEQPGAEQPVDKDRKLVDTGWGVKPDSQPASAEEVRDLQTSVVYHPGQANQVDAIIRTQQRNFNSAARIVIEPGRTRIFDINNDEFVVEGLTFGDPALIEMLRKFGAAFDPKVLGALNADFDGAREYRCTTRYAWGADRTG
jgi:hypothetical protein